MEHLLFECPFASGLGSSMAITILRDDLFRVCSGSDHAEAGLLAAFPSSHAPVVPATACLPASPRPCCCPGPSPPLAHEFAVVGSCRGVPAWCVVRGVNPPAPVHVNTGTLSPSCLVLRPLVVAPPAVRFCICPGAPACLCV